MAALIVAALYLDPVLGNAPWLAALAGTCAAGGVLMALRPGELRLIPPVLAGYVGIYVLAGVVSGLGDGGDVARYVVRPLAIIALIPFLLRADTRRRVLAIVVVAALPLVAVTAGQAIDARNAHGADAVGAADAVTGTFGPDSAGVVGLVALAAACLVAGLAAARVIRPWAALGICVALLSVEVFTSTRAAVVFIPVTAAALVVAVVAAARPRPPTRALGAMLAAAAISVPTVYFATEAFYPGSFRGAFSNQSSLILDSGAVKNRGSGRPGATPASDGPRGIAVLPGRATQIKRALQISTEDGSRVFLLGRGFGATAIPTDATISSVIPKEHTTGATWIGRVLGDGGWLALAAFLALIGWLALLGVRIARAPASRWDAALGYALPPFAALTLVGAAYTTVLDVRAYSAVFIVVAAAAFAAARDASRSPEPAGAVNGIGLRARASTPLPPRQQETSSAPSASSARSS